MLSKQRLYLLKRRLLLFFRVMYFALDFFFRCVGKRDELLDLGLSPIPPGEREEKIIICTHSKTSERPNNDFPRKTKEGKSGSGEES